MQNIVQEAVTAAMEKHVNPLAAYVSNVEAKVAVKLKPHFDEMAAKFTTATNPVDGRVAVAVKKLEGIESKLAKDAAATTKMEALATQVTAAVEKLNAAPPATTAASAPTMADIIKKATAKSATVVIEALQRQEEQRREEKERQNRASNAILRHFPQAPDETKQSLTAALDDFLDRLGLRDEVAMEGMRLPNPRGKAGPPPIRLLFATQADRALVFAARKRLQGTPWSLDEDLTPAQQQQRKALFEVFKAQRSQHPQTPVYWKGGDLYVNHKLYRPPPEGGPSVS